MPDKKITVSELGAVVTVFAAIGGVVAAHFLGIAQAKEYTDKKIKDYVTKEVFSEIKTYMGIEFRHVNERLDEIKDEIRGKDESQTGRPKSGFQDHSVRVSGQTD